MTRVSKETPVTDASLKDSPDPKGLRNTLQIPQVLPTLILLLGPGLTMPSEQLERGLEASESPL